MLLYQGSRITKKAVASLLINIFRRNVFTGNISFLHFLAKSFNTEVPATQIIFIIEIFIIFREIPSKNRMKLQISRSCFVQSVHKILKHLPNKRTYVPEECFSFNDHSHSEQSRGSGATAACVLSYKPVSSVNVNTFVVPMATTLKGKGVH